MLTTKRIAANGGVLQNTPTNLWWSFCPKEHGMVFIIFTIFIWFTGSKLLVIGGYYANGLYSEVIDLNDASAVCSRLSNPPYTFGHGTGGLINGNLPIACGGFNDSPRYFYESCFILGSSTSITMSQKRDGASSIVYGDKVSQIGS